MSSTKGRANCFPVRQLRRERGGGDEVQQEGEAETTPPSADEGREEGGGAKSSMKGRAKRSGCGKPFFGHVIYI